MQDERVKVVSYDACRVAMLIRAAACHVIDLEEHKAPKAVIHSSGTCVHVLCICSASLAVHVLHDIMFVADVPMYHVTDRPELTPVAIQAGIHWARRLYAGVSHASHRACACAA